ncbi:hypothetical protein I4U23_025708 [Adineta vaga]|nr:hypothetical protein I4U23_025708 [Adineta vaga]
MSVWDETSSPSVGYHAQQSPTSAELALKQYTAKLGLTNNFRKVTPENGTQRTLTDIFSTTNHSTPRLIDSPTSPSQNWIRHDAEKTNRRRSSLKPGCLSCLTSLQCRYTTLGVFLGLLLSLLAIVPILILWKTSASGTSINASGSGSGTSSLSNSPVAPGLITYTGINSCNAYFCDEQLVFQTNMTTTELAVKITVPLTDNPTYANAYSSYFPTIDFNHTTDSSAIYYYFFIASGQLPPGNYSCSVQFNLVNTNHASSMDTYTISTKNICGNVASASGHF